MRVPKGVFAIPKDIPTILEGYFANLEGYSTNLEGYSTILEGYSIILEGYSAALKSNSIILTYILSTRTLYILNKRNQKTPHGNGAFSNSNALAVCLIRQSYRT